MASGRRIFGRFKTGHEQTCTMCGRIIPADERHAGIKESILVYKYGASGNMKVGHRTLPVCQDCAARNGVELGAS